MARGWVPLGLALSAAALDASGLHGPAFYILLAAVPATAVSALGALGELVDARVGGRADPSLLLQPLLAALGLALLVASAAVRSPVPALSANVLSGCLAVLCLQAIVGVLSENEPARYSGSDSAAFLASSISGWTAKNEPTLTTSAAKTEA